MTRVAPGEAEAELEITPQMMNSRNVVQGGAIMTLADFAFAVAANHRKMNTVTLSSSITFLGVPKGKMLIAEANCVKEGRSTCCYRVEVKDELGNGVAEVTMNGFKLG